MGTYNQMFAQMAAQPEPTILQTLFSTVWGYAIWGILVGLVVAAIVKVEPTLFSNSNNEE